MENETLMSAKEICNWACAQIDVIKCKLLFERDVSDSQAKIYEEKILFLKSVIELCYEWEGVFNG